MDTLLKRIGGEVAVHAAVDKFYDKVFTDPLLLPFFKDTDFVKQRERQSKFLLQFMDGKMPNAGSYMRHAHRKYVHEMGLSDVHFDAVAGHLVATLRELGVSQSLIDETAAAVGSLREAVLDRPHVAAAQ
jgi:hemoglobin